MWLFPVLGKLRGGHKYSIHSMNFARPHYCTKCWFWSGETDWLSFLLSAVQSLGCMLPPPPLSSLYLDWSMAAFTLIMSFISWDWRLWCPQQIFWYMPGGLWSVAWTAAASAQDSCAASPFGGAAGPICGGGPKTTAGRGNFVHFSQEICKFSITDLLLCQGAFCNMRSHCTLGTNPVTFRSHV